MLKAKKYLHMLGECCTFAVGLLYDTREGVSITSLVTTHKKSDKHLTEVICLSPIKRKEVYLNFNFRIHLFQLFMIFIYK